MGNPKSRVRFFENPIHTKFLLFISHRLILARYFSAWRTFTPELFGRALGINDVELLDQFLAIVRDDDSLEYHHDQPGKGWTCKDPDAYVQRSADPQVKGRQMPPEGIARIREVARSQRTSG